MQDSGELSIGLESAAGLIQTVDFLPVAPQATRAETRTTLILHGRILPTLLRLAVPNLAIMLAQAAANFLESYYVGLIGLDALAGAALVFPVVMLMQTMSAGGVGGAMAAAVARALGAGQRERAEALVLHAMVIAVAAGAMFTIAALLGGPILYRAMGGRGAGLVAAVTYSNAIFGGAVFLWLSNALASVLRGAGNMLLPAVVLVGGAIMLLGVSPVLIFGWGPIPALGIAGAGLALVLYYVTGSAILLAALLRGRSGLRLSLRHRLSLPLFGDILGVGAMGAFNNVLTNLAVVLATGLVGGMGPSALAGFGLGIRVEYLQIPLVFGIGSSVTPMVGMNIGAGQLARARRVALTGMMVAILITEAAGLLVAVFPHAWLHLFTTDPAAVGTGTAYLRVVGPFYGFFGAGLALYFASQGAGRMALPILASVMRVGLVGIGGTAAIRSGAGLTGLLAILAAAMVASALINLLNWRRPSTASSLTRPVRP